MESNFYYEITLHRDVVASSVVAPWVSNLQLGISNQQLTAPLAVIPSTEGKQEQGLYLWDGQNWRFALPYENLTFSIVQGDAIDVYYSVQTPVEVSPTATVWRNGLLWLAGSEVLAGDSAVWVVQTRPTNGLVASVNGVGPDQFGNVDLEIDDIPGLEQALANAGAVKTVNEVGPDSNGNVSVQIANIPNLSSELSSKVASVNGETPDSNGAVTVQIADIPGLASELAAAGTVKVVNGESPDASGVVTIQIGDIPNLTATLTGLVRTVNGEVPNSSGAVVIQIADIPGLATALASAGTVKSVNGNLPDASGNVVVTVPTATTTTLGLVQVPTAGGLLIDAQGNLTINQAALTVYIESVGSTTATGGYTLINDNGQTSHNALLKQLVPGANITLTSDANGITINSTSTPPGVEGLVAVQSEGDGTSLVDADGTQTGIATIKSIEAGTGVTITPSTDGKTLTFSASGGAGTVQTVNSIGPDGSGNVALTAANIPGLATVATSGSYTDLTNTPAPYTLPVATTTVLGGVKQGTNITIAGDGTISATAAPYTLPAATASSLGGVIIGANITVQSDGTISVAAPYALPVATTTVLGGVKQGSNVTIGADGTISVAGPYTLPVATASVLGGVKIGTGINVAGDGTISNGYVLPIATTTVLGGVKQGSNITIAADGTISASASYTLPPATTSTLGGVIVGSGLSVDSNGNLTAPAQGVSAVTSTGTGVSLVNAAGGSGAPAALKSLTGGQFITVTQDAGQQNITIAAPNAITSVNGIGTSNGAVTITAANITGFATVATTGNYNDLTNKYTLPAATNSVLGGIIVGSGLSISSGVLSTTGGYTLPPATASVLGGVKIGTNVNVAGDGTISVPTGAGYSYTLPAATTSVLGGVIVGSGLSVSAGTISVTFPSSVSTITPSGGTAVSGAVTLAAGSNISISQSGQTITITGGGGYVTDAPNDGNLYGRENQSWVEIPEIGNAITSVTGQPGSTGTILLVEASPPANSAIIKSLIAGSNVTLTDNSGVITIAASVPGTPVNSVNGVAPDGTGNVTLTAANVAALPLAGGQMAGNIDMQSVYKMINLPTPTNPGDAVPLSYLSGITIDNGTF